MTTKVDLPRHRALLAPALALLLAGCSKSGGTSSDAGSAQGPEDTDALCSDGLDNDADGFTDCEDQSCWSLPPCEAGGDAGDGPVPDAGPSGCKAHCDCPQGTFCYKDRCVRDNRAPVYCCAKPGCPPGMACIDLAGNRSRCAEDESYVCTTACDCGPAHCCKSGVCVKDTTDPWLPGGTAIKNLECNKGINPTYCCASAECHAGRQAYGGLEAYFRCFDLDAGQTRSSCGGRTCLGSACDCSSGEVCVDTTTSPDPPPGSTCHQGTGGTCVSWAAAEALFGWSASDLLPCCEQGCTPGSTCDAGRLQRHDSQYAYQRVVATCGPCSDGEHHGCGACGNGTCDAGEFPGLCPQDCYCGDGQCAPEEVGACGQDCGSCGDGKCDLGEPLTCPDDCSTCGDEWCAPYEAGSCGQDCWGACYGESFPGQYTICGDGFCDKEWYSCAPDCPVPGTWVTVAPGTFTMGAPETEPCRDADEDQHSVTLTRTFELQTTEVTQAQFEGLMGYNPSDDPSCGGQCPVQPVTWDQAAAYCDTLSKVASLPRCYNCAGSSASVTCSEALGYDTEGIYGCPGYRLPTEAEWEYAYRAGTTTAYHSGANDPDACGDCGVVDAQLDAIAWYCGNSGGSAHPVGTKQPNAWGLYDMAGNIVEWCNDRYLVSLGSAPVTDPGGAEPAQYDESERAARGGGYAFVSGDARAASRIGLEKDTNLEVGFRCARTLTP